MGVESGGTINKVVLLHKVGDSSAVHSLAWTTRGEAGGGTDELVHNVVGMDIFGSPWARLESKSDGGSWSFGPGSEFTTNVLRWRSLEIVLWNWEHITESLLNEVNVFLVVFDTGGNDKALSWGNIVHNELLKHSGINVVDVLGETKSWHTKSVVSIGSSQEKFLGVGEWVELGEVVEKIMGLGVLRSGNVSSHDRSWLKGDIDHHLEHINGIVLDAVTLEIGSFLIIIHGHGATRHLDHTIVDSLIGMLKSLEISVLESKKSTRGLSGFISGSDIHEEAHVYGSWEALTFSQNGETI